MAEVYSGTATRAWQCVVGCDPHMPCAPRCWAVKTVNRLAHSGSAKVVLAHDGLTRRVDYSSTSTGRLVWTGIVRLNEAHLLDPLRHRQPEAYATGYHGDWARLADGDKDRMFAVMVLANWHEFRPLSKQAEMVREYLLTGETSPYFYACTRVEKLARELAHERDMEPSDVETAWPLPHVRLGFSLMDQPDADAALPHVRALHEAGWKIWVSMEPQIGPIDLKGWEFLTWVVQGCESGPRARYFNKGWACFTRDFCQAHKIPYFLKQVPACERGGRNSIKILHQPWLDGRQWTELPEAHG